MRADGYRRRGGGPRERHCRIVPLGPDGGHILGSTGDGEQIGQLPAGQGSETWWPVWIALAAWSLRRPAVLTAWLVISVPLMITFSAMFSTGRWMG